MDELTKIAKLSEIVGLERAMNIVMTSQFAMFAIRDIRKEIDKLKKEIDEN